VQKLVSGIHHFQSNYFRSHRELFERIAVEQRPETLFITCSDSRIDPCLLTQTPPGELFILRNAGNLVPPHGASNGGEAATIEYAVSGLGVRDIIICGHAGCGAMKGLLQPETLAALPKMRAWLGHAEATAHIVEANYAHLQGEDRVTAAVEENVLVQLENLRTHPVVAAGLAGGRLKLHGWVYKVASGEVFAFDPCRGQFVPVSVTAGHVARWTSPPTGCGGADHDHAPTAVNSTY
jgi:carbonic anhydrase